jgi:hypothetical protein
LNGEEVLRVIMVAVGSIIVECPRKVDVLILIYSLLKRKGVRAVISHG